MAFLRHAGTWGAILLVLAAAARAVAEQVEIVTYYPSPSATTDDLKVQRASVGEVTVTW